MHARQTLYLLELHPQLQSQKLKFSSLSVAGCNVHAYSPSTLGADTGGEPGLHTVRPQLR